MGAFFCLNVKYLNMKKLNLIFAVILSGVISIASAQTGKLNFDIDYAQFSFDADSNLVEFYYMFSTPSMQKVKQDSALFVDGVLSISVADTVSKKEIINRQWEFHEDLGDQNSNNNSFVGVLKFVIPKGVYKCNFTGSDKYDTSNSISYTEVLNVDPLINNQVNLSGIELASKVVPQSDNTNSIFYKNTYEIIPSPNVLFGDNQPALFYYCEVYNLNQVKDNIPLMLLTQVYSTKGKQFYTKKTILTHNSDSRVLVGNIIVNKFSTDSYTLTLSVIDSVNHYGVTSSKKFFVYNEGILNTDSLIASQPGALNSEFFSLSEEELDDIFSKSEYIASNSEKEQYNSLNTADAKREFLHEFWNKRDKDPSTPRNEFFEDYFKRIEYANKNFSNVNKVGWKTDRGRVYIQYGPPNEIDRHPNSQNSKPYEIWTYNDIEGGVEFVFGDLIGLSNYQLLHSTKRGEMNDPNWEKRIRAL